jgi:hypothetical protein
MEKASRASGLPDAPRRDVAAKPAERWIAESRCSS